MIGQRFKRLIVSARHPENTAAGKKRWKCVCDCGNAAVFVGADLKAGRVVSCGCYRAKRNATSALIHGQARRSGRSTEYQIWGGMIKRCTNPKTWAWKYYGGRGIKVCKRWLSFENFYADMGPRPKNLTLDRINNDGNYEPGNCRWVTRKQQTANRRPTGSVSVSTQRR